MPNRSIEGTEVAARDADVGVVDVAIDDVGDDLMRMLSCAHSVSHPAKPVRRGFSVEIQRLVWRQSAAVFDALLKRR